MTEQRIAVNGGVELHQGNGANMLAVPSNGAALVLTSPPYFSSETEALLLAPRAEQTRLEEVRSQVVAFALTLRGVFEEAFRVACPGGILVLQTKNLRYGGYLVPVASIHEELAESAGFRLVSRVFWRRTHDSVRHTNRKHLRKLARAGQYRAMDVEDFLVFRKPGSPPELPIDTESLTDEQLDELLSPLWVLPGPGPGGHPHASPPRVAERFVTLFTRPGDLVVDPFAGGGTYLQVSARLGRRAVGYEIDRNHYLLGERRLSRAGRT